MEEKRELEAEARTAEEAVMVKDVTEEEVQDVKFENIEEPVENTEPAE